MVTTLKLSELPNETELSVEESNITYTVGELKREILELGEPHHELNNWYTIKKRKWKPNAHLMVERYIDNEFEDMYEDWDERAMECLNETVIENIQQLLDEAFKGDHATVYWTHEEPVEIDIFPSNE